MYIATSTILNCLMIKQKHWKITVKETGRPKPIVTQHHGNLDRQGVIDFFSLNESDVEWYTIEEMTEPQ